MIKQYRAYDRGELCALIEQAKNGKWRLFWPRRGWSHEDFRTITGAKAKVESVIHSHPVEWRRTLSNEDHIAGMKS